jgi:WD40 repeat protein
MVPCEDLVVGDDNGKIYYYSLEWPESGQGAMTLLAKIDAHSQNICGLAWSPTGEQFVSGGNDNRALLFIADLLLEDSTSAMVGTSGREPLPEVSIDGIIRSSTMMPVPMTPETSPERLRQLEVPQPMDATIVSEQNRQTGLLTPPPTPLRRGRTVTRFASGQDSLPRTLQTPLLHNSLADPAIPGQANAHIYSFYHSAAVKAIAFAPWQPTLLATSGGSNDRQIHFFHTGSGATLALINVFSQVTSLI